MNPETVSTRVGFGTLSLAAFSLKEAIAFASKTNRPPLIFTSPVKGLPAHTFAFEGRVLYRGTERRQVLESHCCYLKHDPTYRDHRLSL